MADLASSAVVQTDNYYFGGPSGKKFVAYKATVTLAAMGSATNKILASAFGLVTIAGTSSWVISTEAEVLPAVPSVDGTYILLGGGASNAPADYTGEYTATVWGSPV
jgi:hypothetical protein